QFYGEQFLELGNRRCSLVSEASLTLKSARRLHSWKESDSDGSPNCSFKRELGPPTVPPQLFDMNPRPQGIVIREPVKEEDYLEQSSPDTVLFKTPETVLLELGDQKTSTNEIMAEQCAIKADLLAQKLKEAADSLAQASNAVPEAYKIGNPQSA
ncbi:hypothetical protein LINGRAHAP2_LOCUS7049, partial [Linum grandiflorum]